MSYDEDDELKTGDDLENEEAPLDLPEEPLEDSEEEEFDPDSRYH